MAYEERNVRGTGLVLWRSIADSSTGIVVTPDGALDLMWFRGRLVLAGPDTETQRFDAVAGDLTWGLRLLPGLACQLLGVPANELTNQRIELSDLTRVASVWEDLCRHGPRAGLLGVQQYLANRNTPDRSVLRRAILIDRAARQGVPLSALIDELGISERTLRRFSNQVFGYGVKTLTAIHRLQRALVLGRSGQLWTDAAAAAGYADHAHLVRDCRRFTDMAPSEFCPRA